MKNPFNKRKKPDLLTEGKSTGESLRPTLMHLPGDKEATLFVEGGNLERAPHNPYQKLITVDEQQLTATELVAAARSMPEMVQAVGTIAKRFEQFVQNIDAINRGLQDFKRDIMVPFREELKYLRYTTGDRLNHASTNLETYVSKLDKVLWAALRAQGMSDEKIRAFRVENGMQPEAPTGQELEAHLQKMEAMERTIELLTNQNRRLIAGITDHCFDGQKEWEYKPGCKCEVCIQHGKDMQTAQQQAARG